MKKIKSGQRKKVHYVEWNKDKDNRVLIRNNQVRKQWSHICKVLKEKKTINIEFYTQ